MEVQLIIPENCFKDMRQTLLPQADTNEHFGFAVSGFNYHSRGCDILMRMFIPADRSCLINQSGSSVKPNPAFTSYIWQLARQSNSGLIDIHTHPFSDTGVAFSGIDDRSEAESFPKVIEFLGKDPHASLVFGRNSIAARWYNPKTKSTEPIKNIKILGQKVTTIIPANYENGESNLTEGNKILREIHDRQILVFGEQGQKALQRQKVAIAGVGGIGSEVFVKLVRLGIRKIVIVDPDIVEHSNLNRLAGSTLKDAKKARPKVRVLAKYASQITPYIEVTPIQASILDERAENELKSCDVIFGCTDNQHSRVALNNLSIRYLIPYVDCATGIHADPAKQIQDAGGQVRIIIPGMGCLSCISGINLSVAQQEMLPEPERQIAIQRGYIAGADFHAPAVASLNGVIANLAVTEFMSFVTGFKPVHRYVFYDFLKAQAFGFNFENNPNCFTCSPAGLLGAGDKGISIPVNMLTDELKESEGEINMDTKPAITNKALVQLLTAAHAKKINIDGDHEALWFLIEDVKLGRPFNRSKAQVMVKFSQNNNNPVILVPEKLTLDVNSNVCPYLLQKSRYIKGWRAVCPYMIQDVGDELFEFITCLTGLLSNPCLCGLIGCEGKTIIEEKMFSRRKCFSASYG
jgi:molybdopterin/thiamine biosynthesis adenylyltransferase